MKKIYDFNKPHLDLEDKQIPSSNLAQTLSNILASCTFGDEEKLSLWAKQLWKKQPIELDQEEKEWIKTLLQKAEIPALLKNQLTQILKSEQK